MIILSTCSEVNEKTRKREILVSHGVNAKTLENVCLSCEPLDYYISSGLAVFNPTLGEYILTQ